MDEKPDKKIPSDSELLNAIQTGSAEAKEELYRRHDPELLQFIIGYLASHGCMHSSDHASGVRTETWLRIFSKSHQLRVKDKFEKWRNSIATNNAKVHLKPCIKKQNTSVELNDESLLPEGEVFGYYKSRDAAIDAAMILKLAESNSPKFAKILHLKLGQNGITWNEIATQMAEDSGTLRKFYQRELIKLQILIKQRKKSDGRGG